MRSKRHLLAVSLAAALGAVQAQEPGSAVPAQQPASADARYLERIEGRYSTFAGSSENLRSLAAGLRRGEPVTLTGGGETAVVVPPTRPMGYGNITRALDLASRQLSAVGITEPAPAEISAALNGGTVSTATGDVTLQGVLQLRSEGMGWGRIAHTIGVHPGLGSSRPATPAAAPLPAPAPVPTPTPTASTSGITTAAGTAVGVPGGGRQLHRPAQSAQGAVTTAAGGAAQSAAGVHTPKGQGNANAARGKGGGRS